MLRVVAFIGVGVLSALIVWSLKNGAPWRDYAIALLVLAPLSGALHWLESWMAHDMAFRLLAEMRIDAFRKLEALAPAYLTRRRTGDLMALATHDVELVEYFFAHTIAPAFVAIVVPATVLIVLATFGWLRVIDDQVSSDGRSVRLGALLGAPAAIRAGEPEAQMAVGGLVDVLDELEPWEPMFVAPMVSEEAA